MGKTGKSLLRAATASGAAVALAGGMVLATGASASAATHKNGVVEPGELGLYWLSNFGTPVFDLYVSDNDFSNDVFPGTGIPANNNTESAWNRDTFTWYVYTGANRSGSRGFISPGAFGNLNAIFKNTITSAYWYL